ncbi:leucyl/phenylalanyl-tRNA--protein transferase [Ostreibacterium oceani]|uniref:Leucyl/phenylalanyl-tRNA--protein transferase n=1 Tax=Ostreibacterium oceani TaxID=2654998 RepID=A0A6N7EY21_9GAMM|nr:leucyl/phenylalanyl-tRNA--protein transferase [Ostreibacterium oceani]MPV85368.1 leucyl/phenylalanyl-tRNA--protein transferase [Ostreibacterium oceani]
MHEPIWLAPYDVLAFPDARQAMREPDGLLAAGANLSVITLKSAYEQGIFPWFEGNQPILWWSPSVRALLPTKAVHVSKTMQKLIQQERFTVTVDQAFAAVVAACAKSTDTRTSTWITEDMRVAYCRLHAHGMAHSVEVWDGKGQLCGGLYGVFVKNLFCGESMFSQVANASKLALIWLGRFLAKHGCCYIDCQLPTAHLTRMGAKNVPRETLLSILATMQPNTRLINAAWAT